jgi:hypothetical protein
MQYHNPNSSSVVGVSDSRRTILGRSALLIAASAMLAVWTPTARAQDYSPTFELRPMAGAYVPVGAQRDFLAGATLFGAQGSLMLSPTWAITASASWTGSEDKLTAVRQDIDLFQYDAGFEARGAPINMVRSFSLSPFIGIGAGARTYSYRDLDVDAETHFAGYGAVGAELAFRTIGLRLEARDYVSRFRQFNGVDEDEENRVDYRNDISVVAAINLRIW